MDRSFNIDPAACSPASHVFPQTTDHRPICFHTYSHPVAPLRICNLGVAPTLDFRVGCDGVPRPKKM